MPEVMVQLTTFAPLPIRDMKLMGDAFAVKYGKDPTPQDIACVDKLKELQCVLYRESWDRTRPEGRIASDGIFLCSFMTSEAIANTLEMSIIKDFVGRLCFDKSRPGIVYKSMAVVDLAIGKPGWRVAANKDATTPDAMRRASKASEESGDKLRWIMWNERLELAYVDAAMTRRVQ